MLCKQESRRTSKARDPLGFCHHNSVRNNMKNYGNVGKTGNMARFMLLIRHKKAPFLQTFLLHQIYNSLSIPYLQKMLCPKKSAFFCFFLLFFCIYAEFLRHPDHPEQNSPENPDLRVASASFFDSKGLTSGPGADLIFCSICRYPIRLLSASKTASVNPHFWRKS